MPKVAFQDPTLFGHEPWVVKRIEQQKDITKILIQRCSISTGQLKEATKLKYGLQIFPFL